MTTIRKSLTITQSQERWIKLRIENGGFANDSEFMRHLIRLDEKKNKEFELTKSAIQKGYKSGISHRLRSLDEIMETAINRQKSETKK